MGKKAASAVTVIEGADGPTSVFFLGGKGSKRTLKQKIQSKLFTLRKKRIARHLKANPHTMEQVIEYVKSKWGYIDIGKDSEEYKMEYTSMRAAFILQYKPELLGELKDYPKLESKDEESVKSFMTAIEQRQKAAEAIPTELFDIDLCILEMHKEELDSKLILEKNYGYIGGSASGKSKKSMKNHARAFREVYKYYGVTQSDIDNQTKRYEELLRTLARR
ncbi:MAG: hypothetical protein K2K21_14860 [Lachnospiraceae bacterium]|nr:hypothetical protein [Lachnospiraceae bacterium]